MKPVVSSPEPRARRRLLPGLGLVLALGLAGAAYWWTRLSPPVSLPAEEVLRADLELRDGLLHRRGAAAPFSGTMLERYPDGALLSRSAVAAGRLHGLSEGWYPDGQLQVRETFVHGVSHGVRTKWHPNGATQSVAVIVEGQLHGPFRRWHTNGVLAEELTMNHGQPDGLARAFYPDGRLKSQVRLEKGRVVEQRFWPEGTQSAEDRPAQVAASAASPPAR